MLPVVALVGRPNVGKSTIFNKLTKTRDAIVGDLSGLTRDRQYGKVMFKEFAFVVIDTGGITQNPEQESTEKFMLEQSWQAVKEADMVLFVVDAKDGLNNDDFLIAEELRKRNKSIFLLINKIDVSLSGTSVLEFNEFGFHDVVAISATTGRNFGVFLSVITDKIKNIVSATTDDDLNPLNDKSIKVSIIGRPNVGKSTLVNRILGEYRVVASNAAGTTRDSIYIPLQKDEQSYTLIDTAGVRKRGRVVDEVEKFSIVKTLQAIDDSNVVVFVVDASEGLVDQDLNLLGFVVDSGRALVVAINKWDGLEQDQREKVKYDIGRRLSFVSFADIHLISALHGTGVGLLFPSINVAYSSAMQKIPTNNLTNILLQAVQKHQPPMVGNHRIKLRYAHLGGVNPPLIVIHGNQVDDVPSSYTRYLENYFSSKLKSRGTPLKISYKSGDNPYEGKKNKLSERQVNKKRRLMSFHKKAEKKRRDKK